MDLTTETPFRIASAILLALFAGVAWYFQDGVKRNKRLVVKHEIREQFLFQVNGFVLVPLLLYVLSSWIDFAHWLAPVWLRLTGSIILLVGIACFFWSHRVLGTNWSGILEIRQGHTLITHGPYRFVRHPMYTAILAVGIGVSLLSANWLVAISYLGVFGGMLMIRLPGEEEMMLEQFGESYQEYKRQTGCLLPRMRR